MKLKNRFRNRYEMRPLTSCNASYRYDYDHNHFKLVVMDKLNAIREREYNEIMSRIDLEPLLIGIGRPKIYA